ncbi:MAG: hypothetical protein HY559_04330 [Gammaproteobacteria bacterium]|nr:hypothetical protein [Gammaproteobacteria bacterium]
MRIHLYSNGFKALAACFSFFFSSLLFAAPPSPVDIVSHVEAPRTQAHILQALRQTTPSVLSQSGISPLDLEKYDFATGLNPKTLTSEAAYSHLAQEQLLELLSVVSRHMTYRSLAAYADVLMDVVTPRQEGNIYDFEKTLAQRTHLPLSTVERILDIEAQLPKVSRTLRAQVLVKALRYFSPSDGLPMLQILGGTEWTFQEKETLKELLGLPGTFSLPSVSFENPALVLLKEVDWESILNDFLPISSGKISFTAYRKQASQMEKEWKTQLKQEHRYDKENVVAHIASRLIQELKLASLFLAPMEEGNGDQGTSKYLKVWKTRWERLYTSYHLPVPSYGADQHIRKATALARFMANAFQRASFQNPSFPIFEINLKNESVHFNDFPEERDRNFALAPSRSPCSPEQRKALRERKGEGEEAYQSSLKTLQKFYSAAFVDERVQETEKQAQILLSGVVKTLDALGNTVLTFLSNSSISQSEKDKVSALIPDVLLSALKEETYKALSYEAAATCVLEPIIPAISLITESYAKSLEAALTNSALFSQGMAKSQDFDRYAPPSSESLPFDAYLDFFTRKPGEVAKDYLLRVQGSEETKVMGEVTEGYQHLLNFELLLPTLLITGPTLQIGSKALFRGACSLQCVRMEGALTRLATFLIYPEKALEGALARLGTLLIHPTTQAVVSAWVTSDMAMDVWVNILKVPELGAKLSEAIIQEGGIEDPRIQALVHGGVGTGTLLVPSLILAKRLPPGLSPFQKAVMVGGAPITVATCSLLETLAILSEDRNLAQILSTGEMMNLFSKMYEESSLRTLGYLAYNHLGAVVYPSPLLSVLGISMTGFAGSSEIKDFIYGMGNAWERYQETGNGTALALRVAANLVDITDAGSILAVPSQQLGILPPGVTEADIRTLQALSSEDLLKTLSPKKAARVQEQVEASLARAKERYGEHPGVNYSTEPPSNESFAEREKMELELEVAKKIARGFVNSRFPLSEEGENLRQQVLKANDAELLRLASEELPTVEEPKLWLFRDLNLNVQKKYFYFYIDIQNIQITKGCSHQCSFCAANAAQKIQFMPFPAVFKLAEVLQKGRKELSLQFDQAWNNWVSDIQSEFGVDIQNDKEREDFIKSLKITRLSEKLIDLYSEQFSLHRCIGDNNFPYSKSFYFLKEILDQKALKEELTRSRRGYLNRQLTNYYDSDSFDYRDSDFLHKDGTPAHFGDVVRVLTSSTNKKIHITTAGWPKGSKLAQLAAKDIVAQYIEGREILDSVRYSVNKSERLARRNLEEYRDNVMANLQVLAVIAPEVMIFKDDTEDFDAFREIVVEPVEEFAKSLKLNIVRFPISGFSGREAGPGKKSNHDVMACMHGWHVWPDGTLAWQETPLEDFNEAEKGQRPKPIGKLWDLDSK